jgi:hypothetical protein
LQSLCLVRKEIVSSPGGTELHGIIIAEGWQFHKRTWRECRLTYWEQRGRFEPSLGGCGEFAGEVAAGLGV